MLDTLLEHRYLSSERHQELVKLVLARAGSLFDADPMYPDPNQKLILSHAQVDDDPAALQKKLDEMLQKMQKQLCSFWDPIRLQRQRTLIAHRCY